VKCFEWHVTAKLTETQGQKGHTRPCLNPYPDPKLNPNRGVTQLTLYHLYVLQ